MRLILCVLVVCGCTATMVNSPGSLSGDPYAPVNEGGRPGTVKYLNQGADSVIESRRKDAYKQMHAACNGPYRIESEGPQNEGEAAMVVTGSLAVSQPNQYWYIRFSCVR